MYPADQYGLVSCGGGRVTVCAEWSEEDQVVLGNVSVIYNATEC